MNRGGDAEAGGASDLQTDVMRFMAILSLCLVAIFALVQSIPLAPTPPVPEQPVQDSQAETKAAEPPPDLVQEREIVLLRPAPAQPVSRSENVVLQRPKPVLAHTTMTEVITAPAEPPAAEAAPAEDGFSLRFETDAALTRLVARQLVGLYAITPESSSRMDISGGDISFWSASLPGQYHEMDEATVPDNVLAAYRKSNQSNDVKWGVTLPASMSRQLNAYLKSESGGSLVILVNGNLELRR
jgi:hypothetical protein